jgi:hypothetical protein
MMSFDCHFICLEIWDQPLIDHYESGVVGILCLLFSVSIIFE